MLAFPGYGYRRVTHALARDGWTVNHKRVLRVMREESRLCQLKRRFVPTTDSQALEAPIVVEQDVVERAQGPAGRRDERREKVVGAGSLSAPEMVSELKGQCRRVVQAVVSEEEPET